MDLRQFLYVSDARVTFDVAELAHLRLTGERHNDRNGVTGLLLFNGSRFAQMVEGSSVGLAIVKDRILADRRHGNICEMSIAPTDQRQFAGWALMFRHRAGGTASETFAEAVTVAVAGAANETVKAFLIGFARLG